MSWGETLVGALLGAAIGAGATYYATQASLTTAKENTQRALDAARPGKVTINDVCCGDPDRQTVGRIIRLTGSAEIPPDANKSDLWVVVKVGISTSYYPQGAAVVDKNGKWSCTISLGSANPKDDIAYSVLLVLADAKASGDFKTFVQRELKTSQSGMSNYPVADVDTRNNFSVTRDLRQGSAVATRDPAAGCG